MVVPALMFVATALSHPRAAQWTDAVRASDVKACFGRYLLF